MSGKEPDVSDGCFARDISLPDTVDIDKVEAAYRNGVLSIRLAKNQEAIEESRRIPVTTA